MSWIRDPIRSKAYLYSNFSLQQSCSSLAMQVFNLAASSARQDCSKLMRTSKSSCDKLAVNLSCQVHYKQVEKIACRVKFTVHSGVLGKQRYFPPHPCCKSVPNRRVSPFFPSAFTIAEQDGGAAFHLFSSLFF
ncbi:hypothetical protein AVEN_46700-1 [Araneus ventricosus]|uniref:Uncharacterized protein n=1 Tax=Araneus ventricosus TaxID=182803 RepID=A0A4Y2RF29_ARAVE|nr:hypothetical protein AVEN_46700-1 [Araneus ventricosus]